MAEENRTSPGPSIHQNSNSVTEVGAPNLRRDIPRGGRGQRGGCATTRKSRGHYHATSR